MHINVFNVTEHLKNVKTVNFVMYILFYYNKKSLYCLFVFSNALEKFGTNNGFVLFWVFMADNFCYHLFLYFSLCQDRFSLSL